MQRKIQRKQEKYTRRRNNVEKKNTNVIGNMVCNSNEKTQMTEVFISGSGGEMG